MIRNGFDARSIGSALLAFAVVHAALGATEYTASTLEELTNALNSASRASGEAIVTIAEGVYDLSEMAKMHSAAMLSVSNGALGRKVTIQGDPAKTRDQIVLDAGRKGRVMRVYAYGNTTAVVTLRNLTIKNGYASGECGGVVTENYGRFNFENCVFEGNHATVRSSAAGGSGDRYFTNCLFKRNICGGDYGGGGVINDPKGVVGCTFVENGAYGDQIKGAVVNASCQITNCVFDSNCNTGRWGCASAVYLAGSGRVVDCTFTNNYFGTSTSEAGAVEIVGEGSVIGSRFFRNRAGGAGAAIRYNASVTNPGTISGCTFVSNSISGSANGGAIALFPGLITNCTFIGNSAYYGGAVYKCTNIVDCIFLGNCSHANDGVQNGGAGYISVFRDCVITNNVGTYMCGAFSKCSAYRCKIGDNKVVNSQSEHTVEANDSYFEDCELFGLRYFGTGWLNCGFNRCVVRDNVFTGGYGYMIGGTLSVTNTLFLRNEMYRMFNNSAADYDNTIVSCTFVSNKYDILVHPASGTATMRVFNNLFVGTKTRTWTSNDDLGQVFAGSVFSNNYISTSQPYIGGSNINARASGAPKPRLMMDRDPLHPYAPDRKSVLLGAGLVEDWMADALDLAGNERLSDGKVAIGAYETTDRGPFPGFSIIFR